ncbi:MAG: translation initiation factor IF-2 [Bacilli bacterium]|nr:translation initiation factor IF-2 [Bacilli bacterium]
MSVLEYASDMDKEVSEVLEKCKELGIDAKNEDDILDDDSIVELDNAFDNEDVSETEDDEIIKKIEEDAYYDEVVDTMIDKKDTIYNSEPTAKKKKKKDKNAKKDIKEAKKNMYKNKEKLVSNQAKEDDSVILYSDGMTIKDFADKLSVNVTDLIKKLMMLGIMANQNATISFDDASVLALEYNKTLKKEETSDITNFEMLEINDDPKDLEERPAVVTIMGHVDHGKTSLLDAIRKSSVVDGEFGGITQHIGAYQVKHNGKKITFIDTPGHAAFTEMRARGASITDIVIIIVAANDGVMPQTIEAIDHAKAAKVPIIVAVNKIDVPGADPEKVKRQMSEHGLTPEDWGGDTLFVNISAKTHEGIDNLLENLLLIAEVSELKANKKRYAMGTVVESKLDKNVGSVVTLLVQNGTLRLGDPVVIGEYFGKIRTLKNDLGEEVVEALPSTPVSVTGISGVPTAGDKFMAFESEKQAKSVAEQRSEVAKLKANTLASAISLDDLFGKISEGLKEINIVLKADVKGSEEAVKNTLSKIDVEGCKLNVIRSGVGTITESDIVLANASSAIIIGFNVRPTNKILDVAKEYGVDVRLHNIIYKVVEEMEAAMKGMLDPEYEEKVTGSAEIRKIYKFSKTGNIAGCYVLDGIININSKARLVRDGVVIYDGAINTIQREKDQAKEVKAGLECGITLQNYQDIKENDIIEAYELVEIKR